jgi:hypothetical protein
MTKGRKAVGRSKKGKTAPKALSPGTATQKEEPKESKWQEFLNRHNIVKPK